MNDIKTISIYLTATLSDLLSIPVFNDLQDSITYPTYCVFYILEGKPVKYVANNIAFNEFDVRINIWSDKWEFEKLQSIINTLDGVQGVEITDNEDIGYINSIKFERQDNLRDKDDLKWYGVQASFTFHTKSV